MVVITPDRMDPLPFEELREEEPKLEPREGREDEEPRDEEPREEEPREEEPREELDEEVPLAGFIEEPREPLWAWA